MCYFYADCGLLVIVVAFLRRQRLADLFAGHGQLDTVGTQIDVPIDSGAHFVGSISDDSKTVLTHGILWMGDFFAVG